MDEENKGKAQKEFENNLYLEEEKRPGEFYPIEEDSHGTYILNSRDLCALPCLKDLAEAGVTGFKVEGRSKTIYYLATIAKTYRKAIDDMVAGKPFDKKLLEEVKRVSNRGFIPDYLKKPIGTDSVFYDKNASTQTAEFVGVVRSHGGLNRKDLYEVEIRNRIQKDSEIKVMTPTSDFPQKITEIFDLNGNPILSAHGGAGSVYLKLDERVPEGTILHQPL